MQGTNPQSQADMARERLEQAVREDDERRELEALRSLELKQTASALVSVVFLSLLFSL
jgi:hypothetical protein